MKLFEKIWEFIEEIADVQKEAIREREKNLEPNMGHFGQHEPIDINRIGPINK